MKNTVILGLGSNIGDRQANLRSAISEISLYVKNIRESKILESAALLPEDAPPEWNMNFLNMAVAGETELSPQELLAAVKQTEEKLGRVKLGHWSPRNIDIDILSMNDVVMNTPDLTIPHAELLKRDFALKPLLELVPDWLPPFSVIASRREPAKQSSLSNGLPRIFFKNARNDECKLVGIVNVTPDSFSDGGAAFSLETAVPAAERLVREGADVLDIGAESTRPGATPLSHAEEWGRLEPVLLRLQNISVPISVDTRHPQTAEKALALGAAWINDVSGFSSQEMIRTVRESDCKIVVMHSLTVPADKNIILPLDQDPIDLLLAWAQKRFAELESAGIGRERIIFDPGIGFGKNAQQSRYIIDNVLRLKTLGVPLFIGHSRKSFLTCHPRESGDLKRHGLLPEIPQQVRDDKDKATLKISQYLADRGVDYLRVHNVKLHKKELK